VSAPPDARFPSDAADPARYDLDPQVALKTIIKAGLDFSKLKEYTGREEPTVSWGNGLVWTVFLIMSLLSGHHMKTKNEKCISDEASSLFQSNILAKRGIARS
jgi:hypothetical protein